MLKPWVSSEDIDAGKRWGSKIEAELKATKVGILCVTHTNLKEPCATAPTHRNVAQRRRRRPRPRTRARSTTGELASLVPRSCARASQAIRAASRSPTKASSRT